MRIDSGAPRAFYHAKESTEASYSERIWHDKHQESPARDYKPPVLEEQRQGGMDDNKLFRLPSKIGSLRYCKAA